MITWVLILSTSRLLAPPSILSRFYAPTSRLGVEEMEALVEMVGPDMPVTDFRTESREYWVLVQFIKGVRLAAPLTPQLVLGRRSRMAGLQPAAEPRLDTRLIWSKSLAPLPLC